MKGSSIPVERCSIHANPDLRYERKRRPSDAIMWPWLCPYVFLPCV